MKRKTVIGEYRLKRTHLRYHDIGHGKGAILWWVDNHGKMQTYESTGKECHHDLNRRMNIDARWRGRVEPTTSRVSLLPPIGTNPIHAGGEVRIAIHRRLMAGLRRLGAQTFLCAVDDRLCVVLDTQEIEMLEEVALRNAQVGIFWIDDLGKMFAASVSLRDAVDYGECRTFEGSHYDLWNKAKHENPTWRNLEYEEVPRGRVVYRKDPKKPEFIVYMPRRIWKFRNKVISRFNLPTGYIRIDYDDEHYRMSEQQIGEN